MAKKIRVLVGKPGLDGHDRGAKVVAAALRDAGMEVIYTGLHQTPEQVVEAALQEDVDVVALSILSGAHMTLFPDVLELMQQRGIGDRLLTGGGIIPGEDMDTLKQSGVGRLFGPGSSTQDIVHYIREWFAEKYGRDALGPLPAAPARLTAAFEEDHSPKPSRAAARPEPAKPRAKVATPPAGANGRRATKRASANARPRSAPKAKPASGNKRAAKPKRAAAAKPKRAAATKRGTKSRAKAPARSSARRPTRAR
jgi:methylmalonyl-CoA mutase, C-terminal domain